jgi:hypothetical protein
MSGRGENSTFYRVSKGKCRVPTTGTSGVALAGGSAIDLQSTERNPPCVTSFDEVKRLRAADRRYTDKVR